MSLEDIFSPEQVEDSTEESVESEPTSQEPTESESTESVEVEKVEEVKEEPKEEPSDELLQEDKEKKALVTQAKDERRKRQAIQKELEELRSSQDGKKLPDVIEDQEAFVEGLRNEYRQELSKAKLDIAEEMMRDVYDDYDDKVEFFVDTVAKENPILAEQAGKARNPAKFVYENAKKYEEFQKMQDLDGYKAKLEAEIRAKLQKEMSSEKESKVEKVANLKPSLANARASDGESFQPATLDSLFRK